MTVFHVEIWILNVIKSMWPTRWIKSNLVAHSLEIWFGWVEASDTAKAWHPFTYIASCMRAQRMPNDVHIFWP